MSTQSVYDFSDGLIIPVEQLVRICQYRQKGCCRYIYFPLHKGDFYCIKNVPDLKFKMDQQDDLRAQGDNCEGLGNEKRSQDTGT